MNRPFGAIGRRRTRPRAAVRLLAALGCLLVVLVVIAERPDSSGRPSSNAVLIADSSSSSRCPAVSLGSVLAGSDFAVSGTVSTSTNREVVVQIDHVYRGDASLVRLTIRRGNGVADTPRARSVWVRGQRQLVAASGGVVIECVGGATVPWNQETADEYERVLG